MTQKRISGIARAPAGSPKCRMRCEFAGTSGARVWPAFVAAGDFIAKTPLLPHAIHFGWQQVARAPHSLALPEGARTGGGLHAQDRRTLARGRVWPRRRRSIADRGGRSAL